MNQIEVLDENINTIKTRLYKALEDLKIEINIDSQLGGMSWIIKN